MEGNGQETIMKAKLFIIILLIIAFVGGGTAINYFLERGNFPESVERFIFTALTILGIFGMAGVLGRR